MRPQVHEGVHVAASAQLWRSPVLSKEWKGALLKAAPCRPKRTALRYRLDTPHTHGTRPGRRAQLREGEGPRPPARPLPYPPTSLKAAFSLMLRESISLESGLARSSYCGRPLRAPRTTRALRPARAKGEGRGGRAGLWGGAAQQGSAVPPHALPDPICSQRTSTQTTQRMQTMQSLESTQTTQTTPLSNRKPPQALLPAHPSSPPLPRARRARLSACPGSWAAGAARRSPPAVRACAAGTRAPRSAAGLAR